MQGEEILRKLEPWLSRIRRPAWKPIVEEGDGPVTASKFCGTPWIGPTAPWPECRHCGKPLTHFLQLDLGDLPQELGGQFGTGLLQFFYCTREDCQENGGWEPFSDDLSRVRVVQPNGPGIPASMSQEDDQFPAKRIVRWNPLSDLPDPSEHDEVGLIYTYDFDKGMLRLQCPELDIDTTNPMGECTAEGIAVSESGDKLAGWPAWVQGIEYPNCPRCGSRMVLVFQVDSEDNIPFMFGDCGCGHITQCPDHKDVVAFCWACC